LLFAWWSCCGDQGAVVFGFPSGTLRNSLAMSRFQRGGSSLSPDSTFSQMNRVASLPDF
jgi:hypothetical protein